VDLHGMPPNIRLLADIDSLKQVIWNLLKNSVEAVQGTGRVGASAEIRGKDLALLFQDSGPGVSENMKMKMFDPFVSDKKEGTGLGLAVVFAVCEKHGWRISAPPSRSGTKIQITIPEKLWQKSS
jgi:signal transduction histidine kinase